MKITLDIEDQNIDSSLRSGYEYALTYWRDDPACTWPTKAQIRRGLLLCAQLSPRIFAGVLWDTNDGPANDVFFQFCVLGEEKYG